MSIPLQPYSLTAREIVKNVKSGDLKLEEVLAYFDTRRLEQGSEYNIFLDFDEASIRQQVDKLKQRLKAKDDLPMAGVPVAIKDNICVVGMRNTCGSKMLEHFRPIYDATVIRRLIQAGAIVYGKTNCDEFAMGSSNENSAFGAVRNPWFPEYVPGGSSGGSAAAVAADCSPISLGSDTGGSIRQPASHCGVVGFKPTYGRISRYGLVAFASSLDQIGPFSRTVYDAALCYDALSGFDELDSTSLVDGPQNIRGDLDQFSGVAGLKIGVIKEFLGEGIDDEVKEIVEKAIDEYRALGAKIEVLSLPYLEYSVPAYYILATAEASANLARFDGVRYGHRTAQQTVGLKEMMELSRSEGFGREVKQRIMLGTFALSSGYYDAYYGSALKAKQLISEDFRKAFSQVDLLLTPVSPVPAFKLGEKSNDPLALYLSDICTIGLNLAGLPGIAIPAGFTASRQLPVGIQLISAWKQEANLFKGAYAYEQATNWWQQRRPS